MKVKLITDSTAEGLEKEINKFIAYLKTLNRTTIQVDTNFDGTMFNAFITY